MKTAGIKKLNIDEVYSIQDIKQQNLHRIDNIKMDYQVYEKGKRIYFFEELDNKLYQLYCITSKSSFYL